MGTIACHINIDERQKPNAELKKIMLHKIIQNMKTFKKVYVLKIKSHFVDEAGLQLA